MICLLTLTQDGIANQLVGEMLRDNIKEKTCIGLSAIPEVETNEMIEQSRGLE